MLASLSVIFVKLGARKMRYAYKNITYKIVGAVAFVTALSGLALSATLASKTANSEGRGVEIASSSHTNNCAVTGGGTVGVVKPGQIPADVYTSTDYTTPLITAAIGASSCSMATAQAQAGDEHPTR
jgi:type 1 fimbria pilin